MILEEKAYWIIIELDYAKVAVLLPLTMIIALITILLLFLIRVCVNFLQTFVKDKLAN